MSSMARWAALTAATDPLHPMHTRRLPSLFATRFAPGWAVLDRSSATDGLDWERKSGAGSWAVAGTTLGDRVEEAR